MAGCCQPQLTPYRRGCNPASPSAKSSFPTNGDFSLCTFLRELPLIFLDHLHHFAETERSSREGYISLKSHHVLHQAREGVLRRGSSTFLPPSLAHCRDGLNHNSRRIARCRNFRNRLLTTTTEDPQDPHHAHLQERHLP